MQIQRDYWVWWVPSLAYLFLGAPNKLVDILQVKWQENFSLGASVVLKHRYIKELSTDRTYLFYLIQIMLHKQKNQLIWFFPFITKETTVLKYYTHCLTTLVSHLFGRFFISHEAQTQIRISLKAILKLHPHGNALYLSDHKFPCSSSTNTYIHCWTWIVKKLQNE